jgi:histidyl-tRNA synthetase
MKKESQKARGAQDLLPADMRIFRFVEDVFRTSCEKWGYSEVRTPTIEYLHLFTSSGTLSPSMLNKVYSFLDWDGWSGERVVLRPDGTIPVARLYIENLSKNKSAKLYYIENVFSFESTGRENREKWQFGVEFLGKDGSSADVETISLAMEIVKELRMKDIKLKLSHAGLIKAMLKSLKLSEEKYKKLSENVSNGNWQYLTKIKGLNSSSSNILSAILNIKGRSSGFLENTKALPGISRELKTQIDNFRAITALLDILDISYQIDITSTNNFEYYTGLCFQLIYKDQIIVSGGRYNDLLPLMGMPGVPACGFALYTDKVMKFTGAINKPDSLPDAAVIYSSKSLNLMKSVFKISELLHQHGYSAVILNNKKGANCRWIIEFGSKASVFSVTDSKNSKKTELNSANKLIDLLKRSK